MRPRARTLGVCVLILFPIAAAAVAATGELTPRGCINDTGLEPEACATSAGGLDLPVAVTVSPDGRSAYVASSDSHAIVSFGVSKGGKLDKLGCIEDDDVMFEQCLGQAKALGQASDVAVSPDSRSIYAVSYADDSIAHFRRKPGGLSARGCVDDADVGPENCGQEADGMEAAGSVAVSPNGRAVYVASYTALVRFDRDPDTGALKPRGCIQDDDLSATECPREGFGLLGGPNIELSPDGRSLYTASGVFGDTSVARYKLDRQTGAMKPKECIEYEPAAEGCDDESTLLNDPRDVAVSPNGRSAYVTAAGPDAVVRFARDHQSGRLTQKTCVDDDDSPAPCAQASGLEGPSGIAVSADGRSVYAVGSEEDALVALKRFDNGAIVFQGCVEDDDSGPGECAQVSPGLNRPVAIAVTPNGRSVYAVGADDNAIVRVAREK